MDKPITDKQEGWRMKAKLAAMIEALGTTGFSSALADYLRTLLPCSHLIILGCRRGKHPIYLYDAIPHNREYLFQRYLTDAYLKDPFYLSALQDNSDRVLTLTSVCGQDESLLKQDYRKRDYQQEFCQQTGVYDELCLCTRLDDDRWILLFTGQEGEDETRHRMQFNELQAESSVLHALIRQQWAGSAQTAANNPDTGLLQSSAMADKSEFRQALLVAMHSFGEALLTPKEQAITLLIVQGYDSNDIAQLEDIALGTVKNHRKSIYRKLNVSSLSELYQLFMTHLLVS